MSDEASSEYRPRSALPLAQIVALADALPVLIAYVDRSRRFRFANASFERWFGLPRDQVIGRSVPEVIGEAAYATVERWIDRALAGEAVEYEQTVPYRTGERWTHTRLIPDRQADGSVAGYFVLVADESERRKAEAAALESGERLRVLADHLPSSMIYQIEVQPDRSTRRFTYVSETCLTQNGVTTQAALADAGPFTA